MAPLPETTATASCKNTWSPHRLGGFPSPHGRRRKKNEALLAEKQRPSNRSVISFKMSTISWQTSQKNIERRKPNTVEHHQHSSLFPHCFPSGDRERLLPSDLLGFLVSSPGCLFHPPVRNPFPLSKIISSELLKF